MDTLITALDSVFLNEQKNRAYEAYSQFDSYKNTLKRRSCLLCSQYRNKKYFKPPLKSGYRSSSTKGKNPVNRFGKSTKMCYLPEYFSLG